MLESLPPEVLCTVLSFLSYEELIFDISLVNRNFHKLVTKSDDEGIKKALFRDDLARVDVGATNDPQYSFHPVVKYRPSISNVDSVSQTLRLLEPVCHILGENLTSPAASRVFLYGHINNCVIDKGRVGVKISDIISLMQEIGRPVLVGGGAREDGVPLLGFKNRHLCSVHFVELKLDSVIHGTLIIHVTLR